MATTKPTYVDENGNVYTMLGNIRGPAGKDGINGKSIYANTVDPWSVSGWNPAVAGDLFLNTTTGILWSAKAGSVTSNVKNNWTKVGELAGKITVDSSLSSTSTNPVQNKVIKSALDGKAASSHTHSKSEVGLGNVDNTADANKNVNYANYASYLSTVASISGGNTSSYPWRRIMSIPSTTDNWKDVIGTYYLSGNYDYGPYYLFRVEFRTNNSSNGELGSFNIKVIATNSNQNNLAIASYSVATKGLTTNYSDIFVKVDAWPRMTLTKLSAPDVGTIIYYDSNEDWNASSRTEAYAGINGSDTDYASYKLHSLSEYTYISYGELSASVKYANNAGWAKANNISMSFSNGVLTITYK